MKTVTLCIGNSDNKLGQVQWSRFCRRIDNMIKNFSGAVFFYGTSAGDAPHQNACWVFGINMEDKNSLIDEIKDIRTAFNQDSAAVIFGETQFI